MFTPPSVDLSAPASDLAVCIQGAHDGVVLLTGVPAAPIPAMRDIFDELRASRQADGGGNDMGSRLNKAYTKNLVYKDSHAAGEGGPAVDMKRVLDLSPERLAQIVDKEPQLADIPSDELMQTMAFWEACSADVAPKLLEAVSVAIGRGCDVGGDVAFNFRMVDYYERDAGLAPPRCGEHRDFGTATLIFASDAPGLEVFVNNGWQPVAPMPQSSAILLFGWCTQLRSNGRIPAVLHRVTDAAPAGGVVPRRTSAVLFIAPKHVETPLEPVLLAGEERQYISGLKVGQLRGKMARKWQAREGTLKPEDRQLEEEEIRVTMMKTQDDVVARNFRTAVSPIA